MENRDLILKAFKENAMLKAAEIAEITGLDKKIVDKEMTKLKKENLVISPKMCYYAINK